MLYSNRMPEIVAPKTFSDEVEETIREKKGKVISTNAIAQSLKGDINYIGVGGRVIVATVEGDEDKLIALSRKEVDPDTAKSVYYNHKLLKLLFPDNFPTIYASFGKKDGKGISANFRERIYGRKFTKQEVQKVFGDSAKGLQENSFRVVVDAIKEMKLPLEFDENERNYMVSEEGREYFVDTINFRGWTEEMVKSVFSYMDRKGFGDEDKQKANKYLERLISFKKSTKKDELLDSSSF